MWTLIKRFRFFARNAAEHTLTKPSLSEKPQGFSQDSQSPLTFPSQSLHVNHADMSTENSFQKKFHRLTTNSYSGLHDYDSE